MLLREAVEHSLAQLKLLAAARERMRARDLALEARIHALGAGAAMHKDNARAFERAVKSLEEASNG